LLSRAAQLSNVIGLALRHSERLDAGEDTSMNASGQ
jgi:hypothetical protein